MGEGGGAGEDKECCELASSIEAMSEFDSSGLRVAIGCQVDLDRLSDEVMGMPSLAVSA